MTDRTKSECGCELHVNAGQVVRVDTCPVCLPAGAITWLIENGRQLELLPVEGVGDYHERDAPGDPDQIKGRKAIELSVLKYLKGDDDHGEGTKAPWRED